jgi:hypothetical protein
MAMCEIKFDTISDKPLKEVVSQLRALADEIEQYHGLVLETVNNQDYYYLELPIIAERRHLGNLEFEINPG